MIKPESIEQLKTIIDVVDVIGNYIQLKKKGSNFSANCPFHSEKTPSFVVSPSKQIFHCFGCGAHGDAIKFIMDYEKLSYPEAIEKLATLYNFKLDYTKNSNKIDFNLLEKMNSFYKQNLIQNRIAYQYLLDRGLQDNTIEKFELGFAPSSQNQIDFLNKINAKIDDALEVGVLAKDKKIYARLIDRITFPIFSANNKIIAFGGRTISNHPAKYINYTNTKLFNKSKTFYGLNFARNKILQKKEIIITEGYMDVIMLHQAGYTNAVATLGTSLTTEHLPILKKMDIKVIIAYDGDNAGINAALKASTLLAQNNFDGGAVIFEKGKDPADMIKEGINLEHLFAKYTPFIPFVLKTIISKYNLKNQHQKGIAVSEIQNFIFSLPPLIQDDTIQIAAQLTQINPKFLKIKKLYSKNETNQKIDIAEASIVKTLFENKHFIDEIVQYLPVKMFKTHNEELEAIYQEDYNNKKLWDIITNDIIKIMDYETLILHLKKFLLRYYKEKIEKIKLSNEEIKIKTYKIRKLRLIIDKLKKGELIYESDSTF